MFHQRRKVIRQRYSQQIKPNRYLPWRQLARRDIAVFSKGNISRLALALAENHRLNLTARYHVDFLETLYGSVRSKLAVAILPQRYTTHLIDEKLAVVHLQQPALRQTVALMRSVRQSHAPLIENCFQLLQQDFQKKKQAILIF